MQTYQTHIFAPPVTGAPTKKTKGGGAAASYASLPAQGSIGAQANGSQTQVQTEQTGRNGVPASQLVTLGPGGVVVSGGEYIPSPPPFTLFRPIWFIGWVMKECELMKFFVV